MLTEVRKLSVKLVSHGSQQCCGVTVSLGKGTYGVDARSDRLRLIEKTIERCLQACNGGFQLFLNFFPQFVNTESALDLISDFINETT